MNVVKIHTYARDHHDRVLAEREARAARIDALVVRRRQVITEARSETPAEAKVVEERLARFKAVDQTTRLDTLKRLIQLPAPITTRVC